MPAGAPATGLVGWDHWWPEHSGSQGTGEGRSEAAEGWGEAGLGSLSLFLEASGKGRGTLKVSGRVKRTCVDG